ncbi:MAG TPA: PAS domain S-box protein, partial [Candidatus Acidoferrum sp.]|nr:PAS domain S-box protein [Candidatus Acidoferrum sp.]
PSGLAVLIGAELRFAYVNPAYRYLTPDPLIDPLDQPYDRVWPRKSRYGHRDRLRGVLRSGQPFMITGIEHTFSDGSRRSFTLQARRIEWEQQAAVLIIMWDTTEIQRAARELRESEARFRILADSNPLVIWMTDATGGLLFANRAYLEYFGVTLKQVEGGQWRPLVHPEDAPAYVEAFQNALLERQPFSAETRVRRADGEWRWIASYAEPRFSAEGEFLGFVGNSPDVTERKQAEERIQQLNQELARRNAELEAERERWQGVVEGIADEVWVCDLEGKMTLMNLPRTTAMGLEEFQDWTYAQVMEEVDILKIDGSPRPQDQAPLLRSLRGEIMRGEEIMRHRRTGRTRYRQYSSAPMHDAAGKITGAVAIVRDITTYKQTEAEAHTQAVQIELQHRLLEQREQERLQIARDLHDGPVQDLTGVTLALRGILMGGLPPELAQQLEAIQSNLQEQIAGLRSFAQELRPPTLSKFGL